MKLCLFLTLYFHGSIAMMLPIAKRDTIRVDLPESDDLPEFDKSKYDIEKEPFEKGGEGKLYRARRKSDGKLFALKKLKDYSDILRQKRIYEILQSDESLRKMIPKSEFFHGKILMEFIDGVTETEFMKRPGLSNDSKMKIVKETMKFVDGLTKHKLVHVDLKSDNVMIDSKNDVKMIDLQGIREANDIALYWPQEISSPDALSPEVAKTGIDSEGKMNVFATGNMMLRQLKQLQEDRTPLSKKQNHILREMARETPKHRPNAKEVLEMMESPYVLPTIRKPNLSNHNSENTSGSPVKNLLLEFDDAKENRPPQRRRLKY